jgi:Flp pilus assembly protein TadB
MQSPRCMSSLSRRSGRIVLTIPAVAVLLSLTGCQVIGDIFKAGVGVGIFVVVVLVAIVGGIVALVSRKS